MLGSEWEIIKNMDAKIMKLISTNMQNIENKQIYQATGIGTSLHPTDSLDVWGVKAFGVHHPPPDLDKQLKLKKPRWVRH